MVERAPAGASPLALALTRVPDAPRWIDTRGMLLSGRATVFAADASEGFVAAVPDAALASIVGRPPAGIVRQALAGLRGDINLLAQMEDADYAASLLGWRRQRALVHVLADGIRWERESDRGAQVFTRETAPAFDHVPDPLRRELRDALDGRTISRFVPGVVPQAPPIPARAVVPMAAAWADGRPVAFCYPVWQTETLWDVSIETLPAYRRRGLGARAARRLIRHLRDAGRSPVWGALETNAASRRLAARLGFLEAAGLAVFTAPSFPSTPRTPPRRTPPPAAA